MSPKGKIWFTRKRYGWGWTPSSGEGFAATAAYLLIVAVLVSQSSPTLTTIGILTSSAAFIALCALKGETPKWQWGDKSK